MGLLDQKITKIESKILYTFSNKDLLKQAFTLESYSELRGSESNIQLIFVGASVLDFYTTELICKKYGILKTQSKFYDSETDFNEFCVIADKNGLNYFEIKKQLCSTEYLSKRITDLDIFQFVYKDPNKKIKSIASSKSELFKAIVGAITIDSEWNHQKITNSLYKMLDIDNFCLEISNEEKKPNNFNELYAVEKLEELYQSGKCSKPIYHESDDYEIFNGNVWWKCECAVESFSISKTAFAITKKLAKRYSAYMVLSALGFIT